MSADLKCPECQPSVPDTQMSHSVGLHGETRQTATCPNCGTPPVRNPDSSAATLRQWRRREEEPEDEDDQRSSAGGPGGGGVALACVELGELETSRAVVGAAPLHGKQQLERGDEA